MIYSNNDYGLYSNSSYGGTNTERIHSFGEEPALVEARVVFNESHSFHRNGQELVDIPISLSQLGPSQINESISYGSNTTAGPVSIGRKSATVYLPNDNGRIFDGQINEVIVYDDSLSQLEIEKIESYLALKYGLDLDHTYINSSGSVIKSYTGNYINEITGIGRDDSSELNQKQSKSIRPEGIVTIGLQNIHSTNALNTATFNSDNEFLIWANNAATSNISWNSSDISVIGEYGAYRRIDRIWEIVETGTVGDCILQVDVDDPQYNILDLATDSDGSYYLIVDTDDNFSNGGTTTYPMTNISGSFWQTTINPESSFFTLGMKIIVPTEICNNGFDDDLDGLFDCLDYDCNGDVNCDDSDNDGISDLIDKDDDNDGISDQVESNRKIANESIKWTHDYPLGGFTADLISNSGIYDWMTTSIGSEQSSNLTLNSTSGYTTISGINYNSLNDAIDNNQYLQYEFTVADDVMHPQINWCGSGVSSYLIGDSYYVSCLISRDNFTSYTVLVQDVLIKVNPGGYESFDLNQFGIYPLEQSRNYKIRIYPYGLIDDSPSIDSVWDDFSLYIAAIEPIDSDVDGNFDNLDIDSDNDGIYDVIEAGGQDDDGDGVIGTGNIADPNYNGWSLICDPTDAGVELPDVDSDIDSVPDRLEIDSDNDGCNDVREAGFPDSNSDGKLGGMPILIDITGKVIFTP